MVRRAQPCLTPACLLLPCLCSAAALARIAAEADQSDQPGSILCTPESSLKSVRVPQPASFCPACHGSAGNIHAGLVWSSSRIMPPKRSSGSSSSKPQSKKKKQADQKSQRTITNLFGTEGSVDSEVTALTKLHEGKRLLIPASGVYSSESDIPAAETNYLFV